MVANSDPEHLSIAFVDEVQRGERSPTAERIGHERDRPDLVQSCRSSEWSTLRTAPSVTAS